MPVKLIIIGGVAGGATAAARARRLDEKAEILVFERGEYVSFANCGLPYFVGGAIQHRDSLFVTTPQALMERYNIDVRVLSEVVKIDRKRKEVHVRDLKSGKTYSEGYDRLILAPGAEPVKPPLEGVEGGNVFWLRNIPDTDRIKAYVDRQKPSSAVIVGAGFIGLEMAENLVRRGVKTTIIEMLDQVLAPLDFEMAAMVRAHLEQKGVRCVLGESVKKFRHDRGRVTVLTGSGKEFECDMVLLSIGVRPERGLAAEAGLDIGERGGIKVDETMRTSDPDIFAVGDAVEVIDFMTGLPAMIPLAGPANKQGRIAADNVMGRKSVYKGTQGTSIVKVFDLVAASTGASEKTLMKNAIPFRASITHSASHAGYYPGAFPVSIKVLFTPVEGRLLGAQIVGAEGVDKRIDVLALAVRAGMTVFDLEEFEHAYAPPFSPAKDPVNIAGFVASNILRGDVESIAWNEIEFRDDFAFLDLRDKLELSMGSARGAVNIPLNELRERLGELDRSKTYIVYCAVGLRAYIGCRILMQNGFRAKNLSGGFTTYGFVRDRVEG